MIETDIDKFKLNSNDRELSLKVSIIDNQAVFMVLTNKTTQRKYTNLFSLQELKNLSKAFYSSASIKDASSIIKNTIESGRLMIEEDDKEKSIDIVLDISLASGNFPTFAIKLIEDSSSSQVKENPPDIQQIPPQNINYQNNLAGQTTELKSIVQSDVKPPILELEYIEPILQVHYPDGTTKNTALPPRIQGVNGQTPNITQEQFESIRELVNRNTTIDKFSPVKDIPKFNRSNSLAEGIILNQTFAQTKNNINANNPFNKARNPIQDNNQTNLPINNAKTNFGLNNNNNLNRTNNFQKTNFLPKNGNIAFNNTMESRPTVSAFNTNTNYLNNRIATNRASSTPSHQNFQKFNPNQAQNAYQQFQENNNYQQNPFQNPFLNNKIQSQYASNTQIYNRNKLNSPKDINSISNVNQNINNMQPIRPSQTLMQAKQSEIQDRLLAIQKQQQRVQEIQQNIAKIKQQNQQKYTIQPKLSNNQLQEQNSFAQVRLLNGNSPQLGINQQQQIRHAPSFEYFQPQQQLRSQNSNEIKNSKTQMFSQQNPFKTQISSPVSARIPINKMNSDEISERNIKLANIASIQNQQNPNLQNLKAITLPKKSEQSMYQQQQYQNQMQIQNHNEKLEEISQRSINQKEELQSQMTQLSQTQSEGALNIEALFMTEEGKIIFRNGLLRGIIHKYAEIDDVVSRIQDIFLKGVKFNLVYKAFDSDDRASTFHSKLDNLEMSLILIETDKGVRFGGFTTKNWRGNNLKKIDNYCFVFSLDKKKIYEVIRNQPAIGCYPKYGPVFFGCQIRIYDEFFKRGGTTCHKGLNFNTTQDYELNNGEKTFLVKDIEAYSLETIDVD